MKIAIVGKRNAGKSSLVNAIAGTERVIVSEVPGTTRDAIDVRIEKDGKTLLVIDTAGIRKKAKMAKTDNSIEFYGYVRAMRSIKRADVVWLLIDATEPVGQVDKSLAHLVAEESKTCIIVVNKWDLAKDRAATGDYEDYLTKMLPVLKYAPIAFTTATAARNVQSVLDLSAELFKQANTWITTGRLNKAFEIVRTERAAPGKRGSKWPKIYYVTQVAVNPVTFMMFVNDPGLFDENYRRFVAGRLRDLLPIAEVPIRLLARPKTSRRERGERPDHP
jgi:GTP-binding protein